MRGMGGCDRAKLIHALGGGAHGMGEEVTKHRKALGCVEIQSLYIYSKDTWSLLNRLTLYHSVALQGRL